MYIQLTTLVQLSVKPYKGRTAVILYYMSQLYPGLYVFVQYARARYRGTLAQTTVTLRMTGLNSND